MATKPIREPLDETVIQGCLQHIDEALITLEKYEEELSDHEKSLLYLFQNTMSLWESYLGLK